MNAKKSFIGQTIVLTGASEGIGAALVEPLATAGANLVLVARSQEKLKALAEKYAQGSQSIQVLPCDFSQPAEVNSLIENLKQLPRLDGIIHNAGMGMYGKFNEMPEVEVRRLFEVNFFSIQKINRELLPQLKQSPQGRLVFLSSVIGWRAIPRIAYYCATKAALNLYAEALRVELADTPIKVINVYPGRTKTNFSINAYSQGWRPFSTEWGGTPVKKVADKIIRAYQKGKRDEYVLLSNRFLIWLNFFFPKLIDWGLKKFIKP